MPPTSTTLRSWAEGIARPLFNSTVAMGMEEDGCFLLGLGTTILGNPRLLWFMHMTSQNDAKQVCFMIQDQIQIHDYQG